ncbi:MAG: hypothetical protein ACPG31_12315 [Planctomycetota bacterium]
MGLRPLLRVYAILLFALCAACSGGSSKAQMPDLQLPEGLGDQATLTEQAAEEAFVSWRTQLPTEPTIPMTVTYQLETGFTLHPEDKETLEGSATATIDLLFHDRERARGDAFLVLDLPEQPEPWQLTGTLQFDGFYMRAWGTGNHVPKVDPDHIYASMFDQSTLQSTYASLAQFMPRLLKALGERGVAGRALLGRDVPESVIYLMHPRGLLDLTSNAMHCRSLRHAEGQLFASFALDLREGSPLRPILSRVLETPPELLENMANHFTVDAVFEAHTGTLLSSTFEASLKPTILQPDMPNADLHFRLEAQDLQWQVASLDAVIDRPEGVNPIDLSSLLSLADQFIGMEKEELDAEEDFDFDD